MQTITKVFDRYEQAASAVRELDSIGIPPSNISLVANQTVSSQYPEVQNSSEAGNGAGIGAVVGGTAGLLTGLGLLAIPGLGPIVAVGWLATTALGVVAGGATGGIVGALVDSGVPEDHAHVYSEAVRRGGTLLSVRTEDSQVDKVNLLLNRNQPIDAVRRASEYRQSGWNGFDPGAEPYKIEDDESDSDSKIESIRRAL